MYKTKYGYRHKQFNIERDYHGFAEHGGICPKCRWHVDHKDSDSSVLQGPGFRTLREAVENIDQVVAADLRCPHCDLWIGDKAWPGLPSVDHDLSACSAQQWHRARRGGL